MAEISPIVMQLEGGAVLVLDAQGLPHSHVGVLRAGRQKSGPVPKFVEDMVSRMAQTMPQHSAGSDQPIYFIGLDALNAQAKARLRACLLFGQQHGGGVLAIPDTDKSTLDSLQSQLSTLCAGNIITLHAERGISDDAVQAISGSHPTQTLASDAAKALFAGLQATAIAAKLQLNRLSCTIQGYGRVAEGLTDAMIGSGILVTAIANTQGTLYDPSGIDLAKLKALRKEHGESALGKYGIPLRSPQDVLRIPADVVCLCATEHVITAMSANTLAAKILVLGTIGAMHGSAGTFLAARKIFFVPDYFSLGAAIVGSQCSAHEYERFLEGSYVQLCQTVIEKSKRLGVSPHMIVDPIVDKAIGEEYTLRRSGLLNRIFGSGIGAYQKQVAHRIAQVQKAKISEKSAT